MVGEARPGYELWRPNRAKASSLAARFIVMLLLVVSVVLMLIITIGGWSLLQGGTTWKVIPLIIVLVFVILTIMVGRWSRGALTLAVSLGVFMLIFSAIGYQSWFARDKPGFIEATLPSDLLGLLMIILIPVQIALVIAASVAFRQEWHVEEERPIGSGDGDAVPGSATPQSASPSAA